VINAPPRLRRRLRLALVAAGVAAGAALATSCGGGLQFAEDARLRFISPRDLDTVSLPVHVRWTSELPTNSPLEYAIFVDALPVQPGQSLRSLADASCASVRSCVDEAFLNRHFVYLTREPSLDLDAVPILDPATGEPDVHQVTVVLVDDDWHRSGESAWRITFELGARRR
jgi:hypothetical protein